MPSISEAQDDEPQRAPQKTSTIVLGYVRPGLLPADIDRRTSLIMEKARSAYGVEPHEVIVEPVVGGLRGFNQLAGAVKVCKRVRHKDVIVLVVSLLDFGQTRSHQRWARRCIENLGATIVTVELAAEL